MPTINCHRWPTWNYHFPELDVKSIASISYRDQNGNRQTLSDEIYRLTIGRNGVSGLHFLKKATLPTLLDETDAISIEYDV
jgi:hypothetical protein